MKNIPTSVTVLTVIALAIFQYQKPGRGQDLVSGKQLNIDYCLRDFKKCADIAESASILDVMYRTGKETEADVLKKTKAVLQDEGAGWNKGYSDKIDGKDSIEQANFDFPFIVNSQAIIARKNEVIAKRPNNQGDLIKKKYLISVRGTETNQLSDFTADSFALIPGGYTGDAALGFGAYANTIAQSKEFQRLEEEIAKSIRDKEDFEILVTGHSLGGAAATVLKARLDDKFPEARDRIKAITFGAPPSGNDKFNDKYGQNVTAIRTKGDLVPSLPTMFGAGKIVGDQYQLDSDFKSVDERMKDSVNSSLDDRDSAIQNRDIGKFLSGFYKFVTSPVTSFVGAGGQSVGIHTGSYTEKDRYDAARGDNNDWFNLRNRLMHHQLSSITQGSSSHIGSAAYYLGSSSNNDPKLTEDQMILQGARKVEQFSGANVPSRQRIEEYTTPGSTTNLTAPVDIVLNWNQSIAKGQLDLDSHLTGPTSLGTDSPVRFHTRFDDKGSITTAPYVQLYRDVIPGPNASGPEQTRIQVLQDGVYRFYVHDFTNKSVIASPALSQSEANVTVFNFGKDLPKEGENLGTPLGGAINVPTDQNGNVWYVFQLDSRTGILKRVNVPFINESDRARVPRIGEAPPTVPPTLVR
jgi:hypothetical protein